ncbi:uncharacterized protein LOC124798386 isoform X1 [Schistocerca piceifrons]|uniref:uncharacterized protein LOC124798386 isoform X1 n=1 Tax=Schistocerca piceifrons TaxID=274613 RepID=UPI001F5F50D4|nr:uncharacterized protein LOC124798386 isoform X1 [Schistocerca piceifrons]
MSSEIELIWKCVTSSMPKSVVDEWWSKILKQFSEEHRYYHNFKNIQEKFHHYEKVKSILRDPDAVALALFFQYFEYNPKSVDAAEKNVEHFQNFANQGEIPKDAPLRAKVLNLLEAAATHSTEAHKTGGTYGNEDCHYFLDIDVAVLGTDPESYAEYTSLIRKEYEFLPDNTYKSLRLKILQSFLLIPNIYATKEFREKFEAQAKENIRKEVENLKS